MIPIISRFRWLRCRHSWRSSSCRRVPKYSARLRNGWCHVPEQYSLCRVVLHSRVRVHVRYASIVFRPDQIAENLQKQGGFIPGVRQRQHRNICVGDEPPAPFNALPWCHRGSAEYRSGHYRQSNAHRRQPDHHRRFIVIDIVKQVQSQLSMRSYDV